MRARIGVHFEVSLSVQVDSARLPGLSTGLCTESVDSFPCSTLQTGRTGRHDHTVVLEHPARKKSKRKHGKHEARANIDPKRWYDRFVLREHTDGEPIKDLSVKVPTLIERFNTYMVEEKSPRSEDSPPKVADTREIMRRNARFYVLWLLASVQTGQARRVIPNGVVDKTVADNPRALNHDQYPASPEKTAIIVLKLRFLRITQTGQGAQKCSTTAISTTTGSS